MHQLYGKGRIQKLEIIKVVEILKRIKSRSRNSTYTKFAEAIRLLRNKLLIYRMLHYFDETNEVELNIFNREKQLFLSTFILFQNSKQALKEIEISVSKYINENRKRTSHTLEAVIYRALRYLADVNKTDEIETWTLWEHLKKVLGGRFINGSDLSFECVNFGTVSLKKVTKIVKEIFLAEPLRDRGEEWESVRGWKIDLQELKEQEFTYNPDTKIKVSITTNNIPKTRPDILGFSAKTKNANKIKILKSGKSRKNLAVLFKHNGTSSNPKVSKKNKGKNRRDFN
jgi:hypothetical protein